MWRAIEVVTVRTAPRKRWVEHEIIVARERVARGLRNVQVFSVGLQRPAVRSVIEGRHHNLLYDLFAHCEWARAAGDKTAGRPGQAPPPLTSLVFKRHQRLNAPVQVASLQGGTTE